MCACLSVCVFVCVRASVWLCGFVHTDVLPPRSGNFTTTKSMNLLVGMLWLLESAGLVRHHSSGQFLAGHLHLTDLSSLPHISAASLPCLEVH